MIVNAYTIYDTKSLVYSNPFYAPTHGAAVRVVQDAANDMNTSLGRHPADFVVYHVAQYDDSKGTFLPIEPREHVIDVAALIHHKPVGDLFNKEA